MMLSYKKLKEIFKLDFLRYEQSSSKAKYIKNPNRQPNINLMLSGEEKYWPGPGSSADENKKILILYDITNAAWSDGKLVDVSACLNTLIEEYEIYIYGPQDKLTLMTKDHIDKFKSKVAMPTQIQKPDEIIQKAIIDLKDKKITESQITILDNFKINKMLQAAESVYALDGDNDVDVAELFRLNNQGLSTAYINKYLEEIHPEGVNFVMQDFGGDGRLGRLAQLTHLLEQLPEQLRKQMPEPHFTKIRHIDTKDILEYDHLPALIKDLDTNDDKKLNQLSINNTNNPIFKQDFFAKKIATFKIKKLAIKDSSLSLFKKYSFIGLEQLEISACNDWNLLELNNSQKESLKEITIKNQTFNNETSFSIAKLLKLLEGANNLEVLNLDSVSLFELAKGEKPINFNEKFKIKQLKHLTEINIDNTDVDDNILNLLLQLAPNLEVLSIRGEKHRITEYFKCQSELPNLRILDVSNQLQPYIVPQGQAKTKENFSIRSNYIRQLLEHTPNLEHLKIQNTAIPQMYLGYKPLNKLKSVDANLGENYQYVRNGNDRHFFNYIVNNAPALESFKMNGLKTSLFRIPAEKLNEYAKYGDIILSSSSISKIDLSSSSMLNHDAEAMFKAMPKLEQCNLATDSIEDGLVSLSKYAENLQELECSNYNPSDNLYNIQPMPSLEILKMTNAMNSLSPHLNALTDAAANLQEILIQGLQDKKNKVYLTKPLKKNCLNNAKKIRIDNFETDLAGDANSRYFRKKYNVVSEILNNSPNVEELMLFNQNSPARLIGADLADDVTFNNLKAISLINLEKFDVFMYRLLTKSPHCHYLRLSSLNSDWGKVPIPILSELENLEILDSDISQAIFIHLLESAPNLKNIKLSRCKNITHLPISALKNIKNIRLEGMNIDNQDEVASLENLELLTTNNSKQKTNTSDALGIKEELKQNFRNMEIGTVKKSRELDIDTEEDLRESDVTEVFIDQHGNKPHPKEYRIKIYNSLKLKEGEFNKSDNPFILTNEPDDLELIEPKLQCSQNDLRSVFKSQKMPYGMESFRGKFKRKPTKEWIAIPSLSANEKITHFSVHGVDPSKYKLRYSKRHNLHYISFNADVRDDVTIELILNKKKANPNLKNKTLEKLRRQYENTSKTNISLKNNEEVGSAEEWLQAFIDSKGGACRHKAVAFFADAKAKFNLHNIRICGNQCHDKVEIQENDGDEWVACEVGGVEAKLNITSSFDNESDLEDKKEENKKVDDIQVEHKHAEDVLTQQVPLNELQSNQPPPQSIQPAAVPQNIRKLRPAIVVVHRENPAFTQKEQIEKTPLHIANEVLSHYGMQRVLLDVKTDKDVEEFQTLIRNTAKHKHQPIFYIDSADELHTAFDSLKRLDDDSVEIKKGPGGALYEFLRDHKQLTDNQTGPPVLLINWNRFSHEEIVQMNSVIDEFQHRKIDDEPVPDNFAIINLFNSHRSDAYGGSDFYSREDEHLEVKYQSNQFLVQKEPTPVGETKSFYLHQSEEWQSLLFGQWKIKGETLAFNYEEAPLIEALLKNQPLLLHDAPIKDRAFQLFMQQIQLEREIEIGGKKYPIPDGFCIQCSDKKYDLSENAIKDDRFHFYKTNQSPPEGIKVLNPSSFSQLLFQYDTSDTGLQSIDGWLKASANKTLQLYCSHNLSLAQWGLLCEHAAKHSIKLEIIYGDNVTLPADFTRCKQSQYASEIKPNHFVDVIETNNFREVLASFNKDECIIDCTDYEVSELFDTLERDPKRGRFFFQKKYGFVNQALAQGRDIVLKGPFSEEMRHHLCQFAMTTPRPPGRLKIVTEKPLPELKYLSQYTQHRAKNPRKDVQKKVTEEPAYLDTDLSEKTCEEFLKNRSKLLRNAIKSSPFTLLAGPTGVGKSTFIYEYFAKEPGVRVYYGFESSEEWGNDKGDDVEDIVIFIDEANIAEEIERQYTKFAGRVNNKNRSIILDGKEILLTPKHKIVCGCNPKSYGGDRYLPKLFEDYDHNVVKFNRLPMAQLKHKVIAPILETIELDKKTKNAVNDVFLEVYRIIQSKSGNKEWITPRELRSMAWMFAVHYRPGIDPKQLANHCAYTIGCSVVPPQQQNILQSFKTNLDLKSALTELEDYTITPSRTEAALRLYEFLEIRKRKTVAKHLTGELNAFLLEGAPGTGKSQLIEKTLQNRGIYAADINQALAEELKPPDQYEAKPNIYYHIPVGMPFVDKKKLLIRAFYEGAVVLIDEINSSATMERLMNDLLSGYYNGTTSKNKSFVLLCTQNPPVYGGRREFSDAFLRRCLKTNVSEYNYQENVTVLKNKFKIPEALGEQIVDDYYRANKTAKPRHTLRKLIKKRETAIGYVAETLDERLMRLTPLKVAELLNALYEWPDHEYLHNISDDRFYYLIRDLSEESAKAVCEFAKTKNYSFIDDDQLMQYLENDLKGNALKAFREVFNRKAPDDEVIVAAPVVVEVKPRSERSKTTSTRDNITVDNNSADLEAEEAATAETPIFKKDPATNAFYNTMNFCSFPLRLVAGLIDYSLSFAWNLLVNIAILPAVSYKVLTRKSNFTDSYQSVRNSISPVPDLMKIITTPISFVLEKLVGGLLGIIPAAIAWGITKLFTKKSSQEISISDSTLPEKNTLEVQNNSHIPKVEQEKPWLSNILGKNMSPMTYYYKHKFKERRETKHSENQPSTNPSPASKNTRSK